LRLLGPDLRDPLILSVDTSMTIQAVKERALENWPSGMDVPQVSQLRIIHQGRFLADTQTLKEIKCTEETAMHIVIKALGQKPAGSDAPQGGGSAGASASNGRCACIIS